MHDTFFVKVLDSREHLAHDVSSVPLCEALSCDNSVKELTAGAVLHDYVHITVVDVALIKLHNVGMIDSL